MEKIAVNHLILCGDLYIETLLKLELQDKEDSHSKAHIEARIRPDCQEQFLNTDYQNQRVLILEEIDGTEQSLFRGQIEQITCSIIHKVLTVHLYCISNTTEIDRKKVCRSFQDPAQTYESILDEITVEQNAGYAWKLTGAGDNCQPMIQYKETDWEFIRRLGSHFQRHLFVNAQLERPSFFIGLPNRKQRAFTKEQIENIEISKGYTSCQLQTKELWEQGDYIVDMGKTLWVCRRSISFCEGAISHVYELRDAHGFDKEKEYNRQIKGQRLPGSIVKVEEESVYLQLDIDMKEQAKFPWPWKPETGNIAYIMPETGVKAYLYFPTEQEKEAYAVHAVRENGTLSENVQERQWVTAADKKIQLYPGLLALKGKKDKVSMMLKDGNGITLNSHMSIVMRAAGSAKVIGKNIVIKSPLSITGRNAQSNIEIAGNFNFYAPGGVKTLGEGNGGSELAYKPSGSNQKEEHWKASYLALAAVPGVDLSSEESTGMAQLLGCGAIPTIGGGACTVNMSEMMEGSRAEEVSFPEVMSSMDLFTVKGGYALPGEE